MTILLAVSTVLALSLICMSMQKGLPESLSAVYYKFGKNGWVFQLFLYMTAMSLLPVWIEVSEYTFLPFLACSSLLFVAGAPCFKAEFQGKIHYTSALLCCIAAVLWQILEGLWDVTLWFFFIGGMLTLKNKSKWCWWLECAVISSLLCSALYFFHFSYVSES